MTIDELFVQMEASRHAMRNVGEQIEEKKEELQNFELDVDAYEEEYKDMLDDMGDIEIGNLHYMASYTLKSVDPTAYRCGLIDYVDGLNVSDDIDYKELEEELEALEEQYVFLSEQLQEYKQQYAELEGDE